MDKIEEGRWYRHREKPERLVKIRRVWEQEDAPGTLGVAFDIEDPDIPSNGERGSALDVRLFRTAYRYDPTIQGNTPFELADAIELRKKLQRSIEYALIIAEAKNPQAIAELFMRLVSHENACTIRDSHLTERGLRVAALIDEAVSLEEIEELTGQ